MVIQEKSCERFHGILGENDKKYENEKFIQKIIIMTKKQNWQKNAKKDENDKKYHKQKLLEW